MHSLFTYFGNKLLLEDKELFSRGVDEVFAHSVLMSVSTEGDPLLVEQVKEHLQANGLQVRQEVISKVTFVVVFVGICCCCSVFVQCLNCWKHIFFRLKTKWLALMGNRILQQDLQISLRPFIIAFF